MTERREPGIPANSEGGPSGPAAQPPREEKMTDLAQTPEPPYYAVIFTAILNPTPSPDYAETAQRMLTLASAQPGFLGIDMAKENGVDVTVSYWKDETSIAAWKRHDEHAFAQYEGKTRWYDAYEIRVARVERAYGSS